MEQKIKEFINEVANKNLAILDFKKSLLFIITPLYGILISCHDLKGNTQDSKCLFLTVLVLLLLAILSGVISIYADVYYYKQKVQSYYEKKPQQYKCYEFPNFSVRAGKSNKFFSFCGIAFYTLSFLVFIGLTIYTFKTYL